MTRPRQEQTAATPVAALPQRTKLSVKSPSPLLGFNNNVRHKGRVFHIQTEDSGVKHPHIITHLFADGGRILKTTKTSYADHLGEATMAEKVRAMMQEQHKAMFIALRDGQFDHLLDLPPERPSAPGPAPSQSGAADRASGAGAGAPLSARSASSIQTPAPTPSAKTPAPPVSSAKSPSASSASSAPSASAMPAQPPPLPAPAAATKTPSVPAPAATKTPSVPAPAAAKMPSVPPAAKTPSVPPAAKTPSVPPAAMPEATLPKRASSRPALELSPDALQKRSLSPMETPAAKPADAAARAPIDLDALERAAEEVHAPFIQQIQDLPPPPAAVLSKRPSQHPSGSYRSVSDSSTQGQSASADLGGGAAGRHGQPRPASLFGSARPAEGMSIFGEDLISEKSLDEVILSYLAEDLDTPDKK
jgi:hypothetical protein